MQSTKTQTDYQIFSAGLEKMEQQAGAELGQAQIKLGLHFN